MLTLVARFRDGKDGVEGARSKYAASGGYALREKVYDGR